MRVAVNVLGPLEFSVAGVSALPTASKQRHLLAMLAVNARQIMPAAALMEELWGQRPPRSGLATLQTYILQLRRRLTDVLTGHGSCSAKDILVTTPTGYRLDIAPDAVDAARYDQLAAAGHSAMNGGDFAEAARLLGAALSLWRGPALTDVQVGPHLAAEAMRLEENRLRDLDRRIDADLRIGRHQQLLGELAMLCARHPMMENFFAHYMVALYRSGRQWQALRVYRTLRDTLVDQLGIEPSRRLRELQHALLCGDPAIDDPGFFSGNRFSTAIAG